MNRKSFEQRFLEKVAIGDGNECWVWTAATNGVGYGKMSLGLAQGDAYRLIGAHRASWMIFRGCIPAGQLVLHHCDNPPCVNPDHLFLGGKSENAIDMVRKNRHKAAVRPDTVSRGEANGRAKLNIEQVRVIRSRLAAGETIAHIARVFAVSESLVRAIAQGRLWRGITPSPAEVSPSHTFPEQALA